MVYSDEENFKKHGVIESGGVAYDVDVFVENSEMLIIQVENRLTLEEWVGKYDSSYIEELSHKTGNFKQFDIFCSMLESSLSQNSESVSLDILSYEDLKVLREQKLGAVHKSRKGKEKADNKLQTKRYMIMTYTVEFDQIHYPLPLTFIGSSDPASLKKQIKQLKEEVDSLKRVESVRHKDVNEIEFNKLLKENKELREELNECRQYLKEVGSGNFVKELKVLKTVVQNLETDLLKERNKHHHTIGRKKKEFDKLIAELEDVKANERNYRIRCKSLADELEMVKRDSRSGIIKNTRHHSSGSIINGRNRSRERSRPLSNSREGFKRRPPSERSGSASSLRRTPSPSGFKRFDPSAYVKERERKRRDSEVNRSGRRTPTSTSKRDQTPPLHNRFSKPPSGGSKSRSSVGRTSNRRNRSSSVGSETDSVVLLRNKKRQSSERNSYKRPNRYVRSDTSDDEYYRKQERPRSRVRSANKTKNKENISAELKVKKIEDDDVGAHAIGIAEIDARLEALQKFMHDNMK